ncbi:MAG TPA: aminotransferase class I/II-fold pyridoxal phosphate-dependent enzyme [Vicinamibacteria bacterium]|nr:aminotransferase class I/II-fold pyridoxal phosphate-dependent enzyme [Vicinamibacteria bacterium]
MTMNEFDLTPDEIRRLGALAVEAVASHRDGLAARPVFGKIGDESALFDEPLPETGMPAEDLIAFVREHVLSRPFGNSHPRFFGFINATADPLGTVADYMASAMNPNCWGGDHAAVHVEHRVVRWLAAGLGLPDTAEGILTSGGSMANFTALAAARRAVSPAVREEGLSADAGLVVYASDQVHNCVDRAVDLLGFGMRRLRKIPADDRFRLRTGALREAILLDRRAGLRPAIVVGNAGTVNTGAIDPLDELADLCREEGLWFHADGAYGAMAALSPRLAPLFRGLERADSVAADPHKWLYVPYEAGATLVREPGRLADAFRKPAEYLVQDSESPFLGPVAFNERGPELSRGFKALKVWMGLKRHGRQGYAAAIERDIALARFLSDEVDRRPDFETLAPPVLSIANFRYRPKDRPLSEDDLARLNRRIANRLVGSGAFFLAPTLLKGKTSLRVAIVNFRTQEADLLALLDEAAKAGEELSRTRSMG